MKRPVLVLALSAAAWFGMGAMLQSRILVEDDTLTAAVWVATGLPVLYVAAFLLVDPLHRQNREVRLCVASFRLALAGVFLLTSIVGAALGWAPAVLAPVLPVLALGVVIARARELRFLLHEGLALSAHP